MTYNELSNEQKHELKERYLIEQAEENGYGDPSYGELADADETVSDSLMEQYWSSTDFVNDDFFCTAGGE